MDMEAKYSDIKPFLSRLTKIPVDNLILVIIYLNLDLLFKHLAVTIYNLFIISNAQSWNYKYEFADFQRAGNLLFWWKITVVKVR
jgi:hypothetical protein